MSNSRATVPQRGVTASARLSGDLGLSGGYPDTTPLRAKAVESRYERRFGAEPLPVARVTPYRPLSSGHGVAGGESLTAARRRAAVR